MHTHVHTHTHTHTNSVIRPVCLYTSQSAPLSEVVYAYLTHTHAHSSPDQPRPMDSDQHVCAGCDLHLLPETVLLHEDCTYTSLTHTHTPHQTSPAPWTPISTSVQVAICICSLKLCSSMKTARIPHFHTRTLLTRPAPPHGLRSVCLCRLRSASAP